MTQLWNHAPLFFLGVTSLLPLVNPVGTALILNPFFSGLPHPQRATSAFSISFYAFFLGLGALVLGSWCLRFLGISVSTTQLAGGFLIARMGLELLSSTPEAEKSEARPKDVQSSLFYPMAFPLTVGPGSISALITLSAHAEASTFSETSLNLATLSLALFIVCVITYFCFAYSHRMIEWIGPAGSRIANRLSAFLVFCIGVQMALTGLKNTIKTFASFP